MAPVTRSITKLAAKKAKSGPYVIGCSCSTGNSKQISKNIGLSAVEFKEMLKKLQLEIVHKFEPKCQQISAAIDKGFNDVKGEISNLTNVVEQIAEKSEQIYNISSTDTRSPSLSGSPDYLTEDVNIFKGVDITDFIKSSLESEITFHKLFLMMGIDKKYITKDVKMFAGVCTTYFLSVDKYRSVEYNGVSYTCKDYRKKHAFIMLAGIGRACIMRKHKLIPGVCLCKTFKELHNYLLSRNSVVEYI